MLGLIKRSNLGLVLILMCILLSACGPSPEELGATSAAETAAAATSTPTITPTFTPTPTQVPPTKTPTSTPKPPTPTIEPMPGLLSEGILVVYDGKKCKASSPPELSPGEYTLIFRKDNEEKYLLEASLLLQGKTFQDLVKAQAVPGRYWGRPSWMAPENENPIIDMVKNPDRNEHYYMFSFEKGEYAVFIYLLKQPPTLYLCMPIIIK